MKFDDKGELTGILPPVLHRWRISTNAEGKEIIIGRADFNETGWSWNGMKQEPMAAVTGALYFVSDTSEIKIIEPDKSVEPSSQKFFGYLKMQKINPWSGKPAPLPHARSGGHWRTEWRYLPLPDNEMPSNAMLIGEPRPYRVWVPDR